MSGLAHQAVAAPLVAARARRAGAGGAGRCEKVNGGVRWMAPMRATTTTKTPVAAVTQRRRQVRVSAAAGDAIPVVKPKKQGAGAGTSHTGLALFATLILQPKHIN
jgi:hypothetical protein